MNNNISFNGRCPQIRDAQWVARKVISEYPHISTSRLGKQITRIQQNNKDTFCNFMRSKRKFSNIKPQSKKENIIFRIFDWRSTFSDKIDNARNAWVPSSKNESAFINNLINQLKYEKVGNCGEDSMLAQAILKINGVENAYTAGLKVDGEKIDHCVCVFNKDGSIFDGTVNKNTIIIDPWFEGGADFAANMFVKYKNMAKKFFPGIHKNSKITFRDIYDFYISGTERLLLQLKHNNFVYHSKDYSREFMH